MFVLMIPILFCGIFMLWMFMSFFIGTVVFFIFNFNLFQYDFLGLNLGLIIGAVLSLFVIVFLAIKIK